MGSRRETSTISANLTHLQHCFLISPTARWLTYTISRRSYGPCHSHFLPGTASLLSVCLTMLDNSSSRTKRFLCTSELRCTRLCRPTMPPALREVMGLVHLALAFYYFDLLSLPCLKLSLILHTQSLWTLGNPLQSSAYNCAYSTNQPPQADTISLN